MMTASYSKKSGYCGGTAAACTSAHIPNNPDTAILAVSLAVLPRIVVICT